MTYIGKISPNDKKNKINEAIKEKIWLVKYLLSGEALADAKRMNARRTPTEALDLIYGDPTLALPSQRQRMDA